MTSSHLYDISNTTSWSPNSSRGQFPCPDCDVTVNTIGALTTHLLSDHNRPGSTDNVDNDDACSQCASHMTRDMDQPEVSATKIVETVSTTGGRDVVMDDDISESLPVSLECPYCQRKDFESIGPLAAHIRTAHSKPSDNLFSCNVCCLAFSTVAKLQLHQQELHPERTKSRGN